jgi:hypothetical protein
MPGHGSFSRLAREKTTPCDESLARTMMLMVRVEMQPNQIMH